MRLGWFIFACFQKMACYNESMNVFRARLLRLLLWCAGITVGLAVMLWAALYAVPRFDRAWSSPEFDSSWSEVERRQILEVMAFVRGGEDARKGVPQWWLAWAENKEVEDAYAHLERQKGISAVLSPRLRLFSSAGDDFAVWWAGRDTRRMVGQTAATGDARLHDPWNQSLLTFALGLGKDALARGLIERGADVNLRVSLPEEMCGGYMGDTPLSWAACTSKMDGGSSTFARSRRLVELLLEHGADLQAPGAGGLPLVIYGVFGMIDDDRDVRRAGEEFAVWLLEKGAPYQSKTAEGGVHLAELAAAFPSVRVQQALAARGVDFGDLPVGVSPLSFLRAERDGGKEVAVFLFEQGVDADALDNTGCTPLARQCMRLTHRKAADATISFIAELLEHGADPVFGRMSAEKKEEVRAVLRRLPEKTKASLFAAAPRLQVEN